MEVNGYTPYIPSTDNSTNTSSKLEQAFNEKDEKKLKEACQEFEAVFLNMMLKEMRKSVPTSEDASFGRGTYQEMLDEELTKSASKGQGIGIADVMYNQLSQKLKNSYKVVDEGEKIE